MDLANIRNGLMRVCNRAILMGGSKTSRINLKTSLEKRGTMARWSFTVRKVVKITMGTGRTVLMVSGE